MRAEHWWCYLIISLGLVQTADMKAETYFIGQSETFRSLEQAAQVLSPGDTAVIRNGLYRQREDISELTGTKLENIVILAESSGQVIYQGGTEAWHLSDCAHIKIIGIVFEGQTGNGVNIDDAGSFDTPTHHITLRNCIFRDMNASGNNDQLKLSGLDHFVIEFCQFTNGASGGSGIDMVGCHRGVIRGNTFENMGSNAIQAKGGTQFISIEQNRFENAGARSLNLGGSTGLAYFRPQDAPFEAADLIVRSNVFIGSDAPIAYVGSTRVLVENNTIIEPEVWIYRILQETVDTARFVSCGDNVFRNNLVYVDNRLRRDFNIGGNTRPESFLFENNLWFNREAPGWQGPANPGTETGSIGGQNPMFKDVSSGDYSILPSSPAVAMGKPLNGVRFDFIGTIYGNNPSIGAYEAGMPGEPEFAPIGAEWHYDQTWAGRPYQGYYRLEVSGDTVIDKRTAQVIKSYHVDITGETHSPVSNLFVSSFDERVWFYYRQGYNLLYDFQTEDLEVVTYSLPLRGHMYHTSEWKEYPLVALAFDNNKIPDTTINGRTLKRLKPSRIIGQDGLCIEFGDTVIQKIGNLERGLLPHPCPILRGGHYGKLRCYMDDEIMYQRINTNCDSLERTTLSNDGAETEIQIYPNPSGNYVKVNSPFNATVTIFSSTGHEVGTRRISKGQNEIDVKLYPPGIYSLMFTTMDNLRVHTKIVIK